MKLQSYEHDLGWLSTLFFVMGGGFLVAGIIGAALLPAGFGLRFAPLAAPAILLGMGGWQRHKTTRARRRRDALRKNGVRVLTQPGTVSRDLVNVNKRSTFRLYCNYVDEAGRYLIFTSGLLRAEAAPLLHNRPVTVYYDPADPTVHFVDIDATLGRPL